MKIVPINHLSIEKYMTTDQAAEYLGVKPGTIRTYLSNESLTAYKFHTHTYVKIEELDQWKKYHSIR